MKEENDSILELVFLCNEFAAQSLAIGEFQVAEILIENAILYSANIPDHLKGLLYTNISCFFEIKGNQKFA